MVARVLLLAGTSEAVEIASALVKLENLDVVASLAGATRAPRDLGVPMRMGGFGGAAGFEQYLRAKEIDFVLDATHPFAAKMTQTASSVCAKLSISYLRVQRPGWEAQDGDRWHFVDNVQAVKNLIPSGNRVFLGTGRQTLMEFSGFTGREILCRVIDPPKAPFPFAGGRYVVGRPPFSVAQEVALFQREKIDWLVVKNSGGWRSKSKLDAARQLGLAVAMFNRPAAPDAPLVETSGDAVRWITKRLTV